MVARSKKSPEQKVFDQIFVEGYFCGVSQIYNAIDELSGKGRSPEEIVEFVKNFAETGAQHFKVGEKPVPYFEVIKPY